MATTSSTAPAHQQQPYGLRYEPLRRMRGLDVTSALHAIGCGPRASAAALLGPLGAALLGLSGLALAATLTGLALAAPILVLFGPVLVPAALAAGLTAAGLLASGALAVAGVSAVAWAGGYAWRGWCARGHGGWVAGMLVQPLDDDMKRRRSGDGDDGGGSAFLGHRRQPGL